MSGHTRQSRFSPGYLTARYAGALFMLLALGLLCGLAWRSLALPTRYHAEAEVAAAVSPDDKAADFDWSGKLAEWRALLGEKNVRGLLNVNMRHALKLAATFDTPLDTEQLGARLGELGTEVEFSASLFSNKLASHMAPTIAVRRKDLAANMDFQSLAAIISDLDPPLEAANWDFSFFNDTPIVLAQDGLVVEPGPNDRYFRVFYHLHTILNNGRAPLSPVAAWRTAVEELADRLERESRFAGGGGFGHTAKREIMRELTAIPALAANSLYRANSWFDGYDFGENAEEEAKVWDIRWTRNATVDLLPAVVGGSGTAVAAMEMELYPLAFPRDTVLTRTPPTAAAMLLSFLAARERRDVGAEYAAPPQSPPSAVEAPVETPPPLPEMEEPEIVAYHEIVDEAAASVRRESIAALTEKVKKARLEYGATMLRLETIRNVEARLSRESIAARDRADRLWDRMEDVKAEAAAAAYPKPSPETAALMAAREKIAQRLAQLLLTCTEEHPFVREARKELAAVENSLAGRAPDPAALRDAEILAARVAAMNMEWDSVAEEAKDVEDRLRRQEEAVRCMVEDASRLDARIVDYEKELRELRESPVPMIKAPLPAKKKREVAAPPPAPIPVQDFQVETPAPISVLLFDSMPSAIPLRRQPPSWSAALWGMLAGLVLGIAWMVLRELFASRFYSAGEAERLVGLPVLAALPVYDAQSFKTASADMKGTLGRSRLGRQQFIPAPVEFSEPLPAARRAAIFPKRKRHSLFAWIAGLVFLFLSCLLYYKSLGGFARPPVGFRGELPLPAATVRIWADENEQTEDWGNLP